MKKWFLNNKLEVFVWAFCSAFLIYALYPLFSTEVIAGWDLPPHYYLMHKMAEFMQAGHITGYDANWFGGYPAFTFYGPLPYFIVALPHVLTGGVISLNLLFNLFLFALPFLFLFSLRYTGNVWFGKKVAPLAVLMGLFYLTMIKDQSYVGIGLHSEIYLGLFANFFASSLMVLLLGLIEKQRKTRKRLYLVLAALLTGAIVLSHILTALFTVLALTIYLLLHFKSWWKSYLFIGFGSFLITSFWVMPFYLGLGYTGGGEYGMMEILASDPLFSMYPRFHLIFSDPSLHVLPDLALIILTVTGLLMALRSRGWFLALLFLFSLIVLPRNYLVHIINLPVHYFRFTAHVYVVGILLASSGLVLIWEKIYKCAPVIRPILRGIFLYSFVVLFFIMIADFFGWSNATGSYVHRYRFDQYPLWEDAKETLDFLNEIHTDNRIAVNTSLNFIHEIGSPHYFDTFLPLQQDKAIVPGLLAESALSTKFLMPVLSHIGSNLIWGDASLAFDEFFVEKTEASMLKRLGMFNIEYLVTDSMSSEKLIAEASPGMLTLERDGYFDVIHINEFKPFLEKINYRPFLFLDGGGATFDDFAREWFKRSSLFERTVIYTPKELSKISEYEKSQIGGYVVSFPKDYKMSLDEFNHWIEVAKKKKLIFLNSKPDFDLLYADQVRFVEYFNGAFGIDVFESALVEFSPEIVETREVQLAVKEDERLIFDSYFGTLINYSYFPRWKSTESNQTVFRAVPSMMFVFGRGKTELFYD